MTVDGQTLKYRATAGTIVLKDDAEKPKANLFFVAYEKQPAAEDAASRPITFVFNGGPGAASVWLHLGTAGPKRVKLKADGTAPPPPGGLVDNPNTWLDATDLVFIDPVGTGYSRPVAGEKQEQFSGVQEDVMWVGEFIRLYCTRYGRWESPKFLAGESYGTTRAAALSEHLLDQEGIALSGIVFISTVFNFQTLQPSHGNELPYPLWLPSYSAVAQFYKKLPADLQQQDLDKTLKEVERWSTDTYLPALMKGSTLSPDDRKAIVQKLSRYTGLTADVIDKADLRIGPELFRSQLLADERKVIGRFDSRISGYGPHPLFPAASYDPSLAPYLALYTSAFNAYARRSLKYTSDLEYGVLSRRVGAWNFGQGGDGYLDVSGDLASAMRKNTHMRVLFCSGRFDLATPYFATNYTVDHLELSPELRANITETYYRGGHMLYHVQSAQKELHDNVKAFIGRSDTP